MSPRPSLADGHRCATPDKLLNIWRRNPGDGPVSVHSGLLNACLQRYSLAWSVGHDRYTVICGVYVKVTTWSTLGFTSLTSIVNSTPCCKLLISWPRRRYYRVRRSHEWTSGQRHHVMLGWSRFMVGYNTPEISTRWKIAVEVGRK